MANRLFTSQFAANFEKQLVILAGAFTQVVGGVRASLTNQSITYSAKTFGEAGNEVSIELIDPSDINQPLVVTVIDSAISVSLETDGLGAIVTDAIALIQALNIDPLASLLVSLQGSGSSPLVPLVQTNLAGGVDGVFSNNLPIDMMTFTQIEEGIYELLLADKYMSLLSAQLELQSGDYTTTKVQLYGADVSSTRIIQIMAIDVLTASTVNLLDGDILYIDLKLRNVR